MKTFIIIASIVIFVGVGALLAVALASQIKRVKDAIAKTEVGEEITEDDIIVDGEENEAVEADNQAENAVNDNN